MTDAAVIAATTRHRQLRFNGRKQELPAIDALERTSSIHRMSTARRLFSTRSSGAVLIAARQRQARTALAGVVEQLLVESKRARDSEAASLNMQLLTWRDGRRVNEAFVAGSRRGTPDVASAVKPREEKEWGRIRQ